MRFHFGENSRMALETVRNNKARSFLTVLGVVIGVGAMIFVASILVGVSRDVSAYLDDYGTNTFFIFRFDVGIRIGRLTAEERARKPLTLEDAKAILEECPHVKAVTAEVFPRFDGTVTSRAPPTARYGSHEVSNIDFAGTTSAFQDVYNAQLAQGRFFTEFEDLHRADVAVIGDEINKAFFPANDGVGKTILVDGVDLRGHRRAGEAQGNIPARRHRRPRDPYSVSHLSQPLPRGRRPLSRRGGLSGCDGGRRG